MPELIIDLSYRCNSGCKYCQWSAHQNNNKKLRKIQLKDLLIPEESIKSLKIGRIVLSGGEPTISQYLFDVSQYYANYSLPIRIITNGIKLTKKFIPFLVKNGIKEVVFSLDSINYEVYKETRNLVYEEFQNIIQNLKELVKFRDHNPASINFIGLNVVLTSVNCNIKEIMKLITFAQQYKINQIKFQPVFDDGFLSKNAPELKLSKKDIGNLYEIMNKMQNFESFGDFTNSLSFWQDLINLLNGGTLFPDLCNVCENSILLHERCLKFCFWCEHTSYGSSKYKFTSQEVIHIQKKFKSRLKNCTIDNQCFCLQPINHSWS